MQARLIGLRLLYQRTASPLVPHEAAPPHLHALGTDVVLDCKGDPRQGAQGSPLPRLSINLLGSFQSRLVQDGDKCSQRGILRMDAVQESLHHLHSWGVLGDHPLPDPPD